ncbi:dihydroxyacetone kinase subunit DhaK [Sporolactobacillus inulinus]|uniref:Dihydroxyacetone kinase n=2 Tax=Sporolactobacillus inulinus TaxID=2078 RepID=A0A0U1QRD6_9BACL|nr:dihydroxyacetone kinase subunit DhaK [Sporolactobacillus inulinus]KLI03353.1 dihydroxyacetone kinase [Sporolactobacillus inulinus CASD]GEB78013.1 PTS-dependent dihydroxyacetone kinase, dihydroxyacetone-binding subunit DhaK [Sporolactobacillus inulinus]
MKKIMNKPEQAVDEMVQGIVSAGCGQLKNIPETGVIYRSELPKDKVALVSGGGSGHEPTHAGFVGDGILAAAVCGSVFTSPTPDQIYEAIKQVDQGKGVFLVIKNYSGDVMNFEMAKDLAEADGIRVESVVVDDDIAVEDSTYTEGKRGVAGTVFVHKILGAEAARGTTIDEMKAVADRIVPNIKTLGVALKAATVPEVGKPGFELGDTEIEFGVGIHGEPGYRRESLKTSRELAEEIVSKLKNAFQWSEGEHYAVLVNGLGATPLMEQYIFWQDAEKLLKKDGLLIDFIKVGSLTTSLDMEGLSLTLCKLEDARWLENLKWETHTLAW